MSVQLSHDSEGRMAGSKALAANQSHGPATLPGRIPEAFRVLDWTKLDSAPSPMDVTRMAGIGGREGTARLAVVVNTPRMLAAANVFAEQAELRGAQVRVFVDAKEAQAWLYRDLPAAFLGPQWPEIQTGSSLPPVETPTHQ